jgi:hypothetical protein
VALESKTYVRLSVRNPRRLVLRQLELFAAPASGIDDAFAGLHRRTLSDAA